MRISVGNDIKREQWNSLVNSSATGTWFQTPEAYEFFASMPEFFRPFVVAVERMNDLTNERTLRGVCVGYVTVEKDPIKQFFTRRAIIVGGPCLADDCTDEEVTTLMNAVKNVASLQLPPKGRRATAQNPSLQGEELCSIGLPVAVRRTLLGIGFRPIYIETRNFNSYAKWRNAFKAAGFEYQPHLNFHVDTSSVETIEANLGKSRKRDIKTSIRDGAIIIEHPTVEQVREYYAILLNLYKTKVKTPLFPLSFFEALAQHKDGRLLLVGLPKEDGSTEIIGGTVCVALEGKCLYEWFACGEDGVYPHVYPSCYATYAGIRYAAEHGMPRFDMMGAGSPDEAYGVRDFKAKFGGKEVEHGRFVCITKPLLYKIGVLGVKILKKLK